MSILMTRVRNFLEKEEGASLAEYGLLLALIAAACIAAITLLGGEIMNVFTDVKNQLSGVQSNTASP